MISSTIRCCSHIKHWNGVLSISNNSFGPFCSSIGTQQRYYAKNQDNKIAACAKEISQIKGKKVEPWPRSDPPPPAWRCECPQDPQPPNYDPYRIKVPDIVVPPLPPSNAKEIPNEDGRGLFGNSEINHDRAGRMPMQDLFLNSPIVHPDYWKEKPEQKKLPNVVPDVLPRLSYHGKTKYKYAFHEPWKPLDRMTLLAKAEEDEENQSEEVTAAEASERRAT